LRLDGGDDNVFTSLLAAPGFIKHAIRLACTGCVTKKNLKRCTQRLFSSACACRRSRSGLGREEFRDAHRVNLPATV
jgi:hypothetical protein